ncbi:MAG: adenosine deaminase [Pseudomonadota bacterium]
MNLKNLPKIELHLHLEGAAPPAFIQALAREKNRDLSGILDGNGDYAYRNFSDFLKVYEAACTVLQSPEDFRRLTRTVLAESAGQGVIYTEIFLSPDFCGGSDLGAWREYLNAIREAAREAERQDGIVMRGIVTCIRHLGPERAKRAARCAAETVDDFVVGFGMGGDEHHGRQGDFAWAFDMCREAGLRLTTHAGEWGGAQSVREALDDLRVDRIGHGIQTIDDPALVDRIAENGTVLEICPGSNVALGACSGWPDHPIARLRGHGVKVSISTDDPPYFKTTMCREYDRLAETFGWQDEDFLDIARNSADAAFCDAATRKLLLEKLEAA